MDAASPKKTPDVTPMMAQYLEIRAEAGEALLFYRMGDFYELFFDDAVKAAKLLDITLTRRGKHLGQEIPMCGVPHHSHESYVARLIRAGEKVAICEQTESPEAARKRGSKSVVRREIVRFITPGTLSEESLLPASAHNFLAALAVLNPQEAALSWLDLSTGDFQVTSVTMDDLESRLAAISPKELVLSETPGTGWDDIITSLSGQYFVSLSPSTHFNSRKGNEKLCTQFGVGSLDGFGQFDRAECAAMGALLHYLELTQIGEKPLLKPPRRENRTQIMSIDAVTRFSLELHQTQKGERKGSLLSVMDRSVTAVGSRLFSAWLANPLSDAAEIIRRQAAVGWFCEDAALASEIADQLNEMPDIERALSRLALGRGGPRDLAAIRDGLLAARSVAEKLVAVEPNNLGTLPEILGDALKALDGAAQGGFSDLLQQLKRALAADLPLLARDGGFIAPGFDPSLDETRDLRDNARRVIAGLEEKYRQHTEIKPLKIKFNQVLGYFIEVPASHGDKLMGEQKAEEFIHRQTLANSVRFTTVELSDLASRVVQARDSAIAAELVLFDRLRTIVLDHHEALAACAGAVAVIDCCNALARLAREARLTRPKVDDSSCFEIDAGRHLVVEALAPAGESGFIANDCRLSTEDVPQLLLVTGPNMAGKSTFLRQNALIAIMAQMGSFVPAARAHIGVVDRVFARVGASDDLARGRSTFMMEMIETAAILNQATDKSLVILDEIGRGTATYDGMSIAWAALEHLHDVNRCRGLFATHYHELTRLAENHDRLRNVSMKVKEWQEEVIFLHEVADGPADRSYGISVARLAGLPAAVVTRASALLRELEARGNGGFGEEDAAFDLPLFRSATPSAPVTDEPVPDPVTDLIDSTDPDELTARQALDLIYRLKSARQAHE